MDIQSKINKKQILMGASAFAFALLLFIFVITLSQDQKTKAPPTSKTFITNKIDTDFFKIFKNDNKTPSVKITQQKVKATKPKKRKPKFSEIFNNYRIDTNKINSVPAQAFLMRANRSNKVRTFVKNTKENNIEKQKQIITGYKKLNIGKVNSSYPVDLTRVLTVDKNIDAILINNIDSSLGGKVIAQIENNTYATQGRNILIPIGSKAIGYYKPLNKLGNNRLKIVWNRIITPNGINIVMNAEMADAMGRSGITGKINTKFLDKYGLALLVSTVSVIAQVSANVSVQKNQAISINTYGKELANLSAKILDERINIKPIIMINSGRRILISPTQDIWFPDKSGFVVVKPNLT